MPTKHLSASNRWSERRSDKAVFWRIRSACQLYEAEIYSDDRTLFFFPFTKEKKKLLRMISFCRLDCLFFFFLCVPRIVVLECPDSVSTILFHAMMNERKILTLMQFYGRGAGVWQISGAVNRRAGSDATASTRRPVRPRRNLVT